MSTDTRDAPTGGDDQEQPLVTVARFEGRNRLTVAGVISVLIGLFGLLFVWVGPQMVEAGFSELIDAMPPVLVELFRFESLESVKGLLASEFYTFGWIVGLGGYLAYAAAGTVAGDLRDGRMDTLLSGPVSRRSVLLGKFFALFVPIVVVNVAVPTVLYVASFAVTESLPVADLAVLHLLSIPYLLCWSAVGLLLGVTVRRGRAAGRLAIGLVFFGWLFESVISTSDLAWLGGFSPMRYFDPPAILIHGTYDFTGAGILLAVAILAVGLSGVWFDRADL